ncbi:DNA-directed RNA polymerase I subunit rpa49 [Smittium culicis]|uniref:DNA-directed RNA polymerase I subunit rpa49 n=1 Tax=Smittium culicis TaxID=133412 RepID=A0A1R1Y190_9FUNG|nr:DNA-directed RNA polymerase I subunit rpa49 [Smittium culicis]
MEVLGGKATKSKNKNKNKLKSTEALPDSKRVKISFANNEPLTPLIARFTGIEPPTTANFNVYEKKGKRDSKYFINAMTNRMEFVGSNSSEDSQINRGAKYFVGVYDKSTGSVVFHSSPVVTFESFITEQITNVSKIKDTGNSDAQAKNDLGLSFGSKKKKSYLKARERNIIDVSTISGSKDHIKESIESVTKSLPSTIDMKAANDEHRPVPNFNIEEQNVEFIYDPDDYAPAHILEMVKTNILVDNSLSFSDLKETLNIESEFIVSKVIKLSNLENKSADDYAKLVLLAIMLKFRSLRASDFGKRSKVFNALKEFPSKIVVYLVTRFTETVILPNGKNSFAFTKFSKDKITSFIAILMLSLNHWQIEVSEFAREIGLSNSASSDFLRSIGCKVIKGIMPNFSSNTSTEKEKSSSEDKPEDFDTDAKPQQHVTFAYLSAPLTFPIITKSGRKKK